MATNVCHVVPVVLAADLLAHLADLLAHLALEATAELLEETADLVQTETAGLVLEDLVRKVDLRMEDLENLEGHHHSDLVA